MMDLAMDAKQVIGELRLEKYQAVLEPGWETSQQSMPSGELPFLSEARVVDSCRQLSFPTEYVRRTQAARVRVAGSAALQAFAWHAYHRVFLDRGRPCWDFYGWPSVETLKVSMGADAGSFYALILASGLPLLLERMDSVAKARGIPQDVIHETLADTARDLPLYDRNSGGFPAGSLAFRTIVNLGGDYYCLGRLCFHLTPFGGGIRVYRHRQSRALTVFAEDGIRFLGDGRLDGSGRDEHPVGGWTARLARDGVTIAGYPIGPDARAQRAPVALPATEWEWAEALVRGDTALGIHIPAGGPMSSNLCAESVSRAVAFFDAHFADRPWKALYCESWLLDTQLADLLPAESNICQFQREFSLYPSGVGDGRVLGGIFGRFAGDIEHAPAETALQRAALARWRAGDRFPATAGGGFVLREDIAWGRRSRSALT